MPYSSPNNPREIIGLSSKSTIALISGAMAVAAPYATVAGAIFSGLSFLSELKQEDRLAKISEKLDEIQADIRKIKVEVIEKIEEVALREIAGKVMSLFEKIEELPLDTSGTAITLILNSSSELKHQIIKALESQNVSYDLKAQYAAMLSFVFANRILAMGAIDLTTEKLFDQIEEESLELEFYKKIQMDLFVYSEIKFLTDTNFMFSDTKYYPDSVPSGSFIHRSVAIELYVSVSDYADNQLKFLTEHLPNAGLEVKTGVLYGGFHRYYLEREVLAAGYDREKIIRRVLRKSIHSFRNGYGRENFDFRWDLCVVAERDFRYWSFPLDNSSPILRTSNTGDD